MTGFTGSLMAEHLDSMLTADPKPGLKWAVAGRNLNKLRNLDCKNLWLDYWLREAFLSKLGQGGIRGAQSKLDRSADRQCSPVNIVCAGFCPELSAPRPHSALLPAEMDSSFAHCGVPAPTHRSNMQAVNEAIRQPSNTASNYSISY